MKIKIKDISYEQMLKLKKEKHRRPEKSCPILTTIIRIISSFELRKTRFKYTKEGMEKLGKEPALILMNHSSFIDLKIASKLIYPRRFAIVATTDSYVGKSFLMRRIGCIATKKFVSDAVLLKDISYAIKKNKTHVLMYPEAGYSFDGRAVAMPDMLGKVVKKLKVPVVTIITDGAYLRDPLYNGLQLRNVDVSAKMTYLISPEDIEKMTASEIDKKIKEQFDFDAFKSQIERKIAISEGFRADGLNRLLYKCPYCEEEGKMIGKGIELRCDSCSSAYDLSIYGELVLKSRNAKLETAKYNMITDWFDYQRDCVRKEIEAGTYTMDLEVDIYVLANYDALYRVGSGRLVHDAEGFTLTGCDGKLNYKQSVLSSYTLNSDFYWYEIGDVIGIGDHERLYYLFPKEKDVVTKARLATEEMYKIAKNNKIKELKAKRND